MGPLSGLKIVEFGGIGPGPFCAMLLADLGADVVRIDRLTPSGLGIKKELKYDVTLRSRPIIALDIKSPAGRDAALRLVAKADAVMEGFRPGVMERLGLGPDDCLKVNPRVVYGRMTGWGQDGPMAQAVGHDVNYLALTGALAAMGSKQAGPAIPLNLVADMGGGAMYLAFGMLAAMMEAQRSGKGQVVDAAMVDGISSLLSGFYGYVSSGQWTEELESNFVDGGAPWYSVYETKDGKYISVGAVEAKFYAVLLDCLGLDADLVKKQMDKSTWPELRQVFADRVRTKTRDEWDAVFEGKEACYAPVLTMTEAAKHPHMVARKIHAPLDGVLQPMPAPRFSRTPAATPVPPQKMTATTRETLAAWGWDNAEIEALLGAGAAA